MGSHFRNIIWIFTALLLFSVLLPSSSYAFEVKDLRFGVYSDKVRTVFDLDQKSDYRVFMLSDPWRIVIDLPSFNADLDDVSFSSGTKIVNVRSGKIDGGLSRVIIDLKEPVALKAVFALPVDKEHSKLDRLVVDYEPVPLAVALEKRERVFGKLKESDTPVSRPKVVESPRESKKPAPTPIAAAKQPAQAEPVKEPIALTSVKPKAKPIQTTEIKETPKVTEKTVKIEPKKDVIESEVAGRYTTNGIIIPPVKPKAQALAYKKPLIVIDPGHGGIDPGAVGFNNVYEKNITLKVAKKLRDVLIDSGRYDVYLTRESDKYIKLSKRVAFAKGKDADLFISIHADTIGNSNVRGASVYTLSEKASDEQTAQLAMRENRADLIAGVDLSAEDEMVANILFDLAMRDTMNQSKFFANKIVDGLSEDGIYILENPHRYAGFAVLKAPDIPSILIEIGFMSNKRDAKLLNDRNYQEKISRAIKSSIDSYFAKIRENERS